eukprot:Tbor_TRINITY_DN5247_c0_g1::TRINITY_DN5247_c0_g1_i1::g.16019::m.16019/K00026/MDH2; malate dehydrogenase
MVNVCVVGASGGIGQPLSLLLATLLPRKSTLSLYDLSNVKGVAADLSHINRDITIRFATGSIPPIHSDPELKRIGHGVDIFVVVAGIPRKIGMTRDDLFKVNAGIVLDIVKTCGSVSPNACFCIITNPLNSLVPVASMALRKLGIYNKDKLFGVTQLDLERAGRFLNEFRAPYVICDLTVPTVPVVGGHCENSIVPLFSQVSAGPLLSDEDMIKLTERVRKSGTEVVKAKAGNGSATLSMAYSGARFVMQVVAGMNGDCSIAYAYVDTSCSSMFTPSRATMPKGTSKLPKLPSFLAIPILIGKKGIEQRYDPRVLRGCKSLSENESSLLNKAFSICDKTISLGEEFARSKL